MSQFIQVTRHVKSESRPFQEHNTHTMSQTITLGGGSVSEYFKYKYPTQRSPFEKIVPLIFGLVPINTPNTN